MAPNRGWRLVGGSPAATKLPGKRDIRPPWRHSRTLPAATASRHGHHGTRCCESMPLESCSRCRPTGNKAHQQLGWPPPPPIAGGADFAQRRTTITPPDGTMDTASGEQGVDCPGHSLPVTPHRVGHRRTNTNTKLSQNKSYAWNRAASQAGRRRFESARPLETPGDDTRCLLASCFANSASPKTLRDRPFRLVILPRVDSGGMSCPLWTAFRHRVGHPRAPRAPSWSPAGAYSLLDDGIGGDISDRAGIEALSFLTVAAYCGFRISLVHSRGSLEQS
jgi:hypothetical protein